MNQAAAMSEAIYAIEDALDRILAAVGSRCDCPVPDDKVSHNQDLEPCMWCEGRAAMEQMTKARGDM